MLQIVWFKRFFIHVSLFCLIMLVVPVSAENSWLENDLVRSHLVTEKQALRQAFLNLDKELKFRSPATLSLSQSDVSQIQRTIEKLNVTLANEIDSFRLAEAAFQSETSTTKVAGADQNAIMSQRWALLRVWFTRLYLSADEFSRDRLLEYFLADAILSFSVEAYHLAAYQFRFIFSAFEEEFTCLDGAYFYAAESNLALGYFHEAWFLFEKLVTTYPKSPFHTKAVRRILQMSALLNQQDSFEAYMPVNNQTALFSTEKMALLNGISCLNKGELTRALDYFRTIPLDSPDYDAARQQIMWLEYGRALELNALPYKNEMPDFLRALATWQAGKLGAAEKQFQQISLASPHEINGLAAEIIAEYCHLRQTRVYFPSGLKKETKDVVSPLFYLAAQNERLTGQGELNSEKANESETIISDILQIRGLNPAYQYLFQQLCPRQLNMQFHEQKAFSDIEQRWQQKLKSAKWLNRGNGRFRVPETDALIQLDLEQLHFVRNERAWFQLSENLLEKYTLFPGSFRFEQLRFQYNQITNLSIHLQQLQENKRVISEHILKKQQDLEAELHQYDKRIRSVQGTIQNEQRLMEKQERQVYFDTIYFNEALDKHGPGSRLNGGNDKPSGLILPFRGQAQTDSVEVKR